MPTDNRPSEFGGRPGLIQPEPHMPTPSERQTLLRQTDPSPKWTYTPPETGGQGSVAESYDEAVEFGTRLA